MSRCSRSSIKDRNAIQFFHCHARFVRRAFLSGVDPLTGVDYDYRRQWIREMLEVFAGLWAADVVCFAILGNHMHVVLRTRPDVAKQWTDRTIARRWKTLCLTARRGVREAAEPTPEELRELLDAPAKLEKARKRLSDVSWCVGKLCEWVGRAVNIDEGETGRCWEGRFKCRRLENLAAALICCLYVDLNLIRAGMANCPEQSHFTSAHDRLQAMLGDPAATEPSHAELDGWLAPIEWIERAANAARDGPSSGDRRASDRGVFPLRREQYLDLLDCVGREIRADKRGAIPSHLRPLLTRVGLQPDLAVEAVDSFGEGFSCVIGDIHELAAAASAANRQWFPGARRASCIFLECDQD